MRCPPRNKWQINGQLKNNLFWTWWLRARYTAPYWCFCCCCCAFFFCLFHLWLLFHFYSMGARALYVHVVVRMWLHFYCNFSSLLSSLLNSAHGFWSLCVCLCFVCQCTQSQHRLVLLLLIHLDGYRTFIARL